MSAPADLYRLLQVNPDAERSAIRDSYRRLAWQCHPDVGGSQRAMAALNAAWRILRDPDARANYDVRRSASKVVAAAPQSRATAGTPGASGQPAAGTPRDRGAREGAATREPAQGPVTAGTRDGSTVLDFGRYDGWSLIQLAASDPDYLEWLARTAIGRRLQPEIATLLAARRAAVAAHQGAQGRSARWASGRARCRPSGAR